MLSFLGSVLIGSAVWMVAGAFVSPLLPKGSNVRVWLEGLAAFAGFCFLVALVAYLVCLAFTLLA